MIDPETCPRPDGDVHCSCWYADDACCYCGQRRVWDEEPDDAPA